MPFLVINRRCILHFTILLCVIRFFWVRDSRITIFVALQPFSRRLSVVKRLVLQKRRKKNLKIRYSYVAFNDKAFLLKYFSSVTIAFIVLYFIFTRICMDANIEAIPLYFATKCAIKKRQLQLIERSRVFHTRKAADISFMARECLVTSNIHG